MSNFKPVDPVSYWTHKILPLVYDDSLSYYEVLAKVVQRLNMLVENNNNIPQYLKDLIKEYVTSGKISEVVSEIIANFILNVKYPPVGVKPAVGDGTEDDTEAIQSCIDYAAKNGGAVYLPYGSYLTQSLTIKDGVSLFGFDRYSTKLVLKSGAENALISGNATGFSIAKLTLDSNVGVQVNNVNVIDVTGGDALLENLIVEDGYTLINLIGTGGHLQMDNIVFGNAINKCLRVSGDIDVEATNMVFNNLSAVGGDCVVQIDTDRGYYEFKSSALCDKCLVVNSNDNSIKCMIDGATTPVTDNGLRNNIEVVGKSVKSFYSGSEEKEVNGGYSKHIGGAYTKGVDGNSTESYNGEYSKVVTGVTAETYKNDRTVAQENVTETAKKKVVNATSVEVSAGENVDISGKNAVNVVSETVVNIEAESVTANATKYEVTATETVNIECANTVNVEGETVNIAGKDVVLNSVNPVTYKEPSNVDRYFDGVPMKDPSGNEYRVLVKKDGDTQYYNVKDYGAKGNGVADDTVAIQKCFDTAMKMGGGKVIIPSGTYLISSTLIIRPHTASVDPGTPQAIHFIPMDRLQIEGQGQPTIKATANMDYMVKSDDFSYPAQVGSFSNFYTHITGLKLNGNGVATTGMRVYQALHAIIEYNQIFNVVNGIAVYGYGEMDIRNNVIKCSAKGMVMTSGGDSLIEKNDFFLDDNGVGIDMTSFSGSTLINKNTFTPNYANEESHKGLNNTIAVNIYNGEWNGVPATTGPIHISNNSFDGVLWGVKAWSSDANRVCDIEVFHNKLANHGYFHEINLFSGVNVDNCMIHNNNGGVNYDYGGAIGKLVEITNSRGCTVVGNLVCAAADTPIKMWSCKNCSILDNTILNYSLDDQWGGAIALQGESTHNTVRGNVVRQNGGTANRSMNGILEQGSSNYNVGYGNDFSGEVTTKYSKVGANSYFHHSEYGWNAPTSGTWNKGDVIYNEEPWSNDKTFCWVCVESGSPGVWGNVKWSFPETVEPDPDTGDDPETA